MKALGLRWLVLLALAAGISPARAAESPGGEDDVVQLPRFEVKGLHPWLYAAVSGREVLSLAGEGDTRRIVEEIQRAGRFMPLFFPAGTDLTFTAPSTLFLNRLSAAATLSEAQKNLKISVNLNSLTVVRHGVTVQFPSADLVTRWRTGRASPAGLRFSSAFALIDPDPPVWYRDGLTALLGAAHVTDKRIEFSPLSPMVPRLLPLAELFALRTQAQSIARENRSDDDRKRYNETSSLLVRWGLFGNNGRHRTAFLAFVFGGGNAAALQRNLGLDVAAATSAILDYTIAEAGQTVMITPAGNLSVAPLPRVEVRPATSGEVARIVGESYLYLAEEGNPTATQARYLSLARSVLTEAYVPSAPDPLLQASLGYLEYQEGHWDQARKFIDAAVAAGVAKPYLLQLQAMLRLDEAGAKIGDGKPLSPLALDRVVAPLQAALKMRPRLLPVYQLLADLRTRRADPVATEELALLTSGTREFPESISLLTHVATLHARNGHAAVARDLVARGLAMRSAEKARFEATLLKLKQDLVVLPTEASLQAPQP